MKLIKNIKLITKNGIVSNSAIVFDKTILEIIDINEENKYTYDNVYDGENLYLSSGFIDIHMHGSNGYDISDGEAELNKIRKSITAFGVTSFLPTTMTTSWNDIERVLNTIRIAMKNTSGAEVLGCHLEGPFISEKYKGSQNKAYILNPDFNLIKPYIDVIKIITLAPELLNSIAFIEKCKENNIIASIGHSNATYEEAMSAIKSGVHHITHTFNAMTPLHHRSPGIVSAAFLSDATCELIADNIHVHPAVQVLLHKIKTTDKIILITDSFRAACMTDGIYEFGGQTVIVKNGIAKLKDNTIAASTLTLNKAAFNFMNNTNLDISDVVKTITINPAKLIGIDNKKGSIEANKDADLVLLDEKFNIYKTWIKGELEYSR